MVKQIALDRLIGGDEKEIFIAGLWFGPHGGTFMLINEIGSKGRQEEMNQLKGMRITNFADLRHAELELSL